MKVITLTTDFGLRDHYTAAVKGALLRGSPGTPVVDISHLVPPGDILQAAFILRNCFNEFPAGSIHIVAVGSSLSPRYPQIALFLDGHYFVGCDNGIFSLLSQNRPSRIVELALPADTTATFAAKDIYVPAAARLAAGEEIDTLGPLRSDVYEKMLRRHPPEDHVIKGTVVYIDAFGNLITDISAAQFRAIGKGRLFSIGLIGDEITKIHRDYSDVVEGEKVAFFNSAGMLEIAINQGKASSLLNLKLHDIVRIEFQ
ncbi:MAG: hypothetical protein FD123_899 [Bacteroidetes bacterium]|nr:MAG: hypothetical protein FD123_899 [Bacteroidota bacterium]